MAYRMISSVFVYLFFVLAPYVVFADSNPFVPPSGKTLLLVGQDRDTIGQYVSATGNTPGGTMVYTSIQKMEALQEPAEYGSGPQDGETLLQTYPDSVIQVGLYMVDGLNDTIAGTYDDNLKTLAQWIKSANRPVYLRVGFEFDNPDNHYDPKQYVQAYRYVVDFLRNEGVKNAAYVWHSETSEYSGQHWMDWYPGDEYVDWFGASVFKSSSMPFVSGFLKLARDHGKPFMIAESTPQGLDAIPDKINFLNQIFQFIKDQNVEAFCYIDSDWDQQSMWASLKFGDARIEGNDEIKALWLNEINQDRYLKASPDLFQSLGWTKS